MQNRLVMCDSITQETHIIEHLVRVSPEERGRCVYKQMPKMGAPEVVLISPAAKTCPESEVQLGNYSGRIYRFSLLL